MLVRPCTVKPVGPDPHERRCVAICWHGLSQASSRFGRLLWLSQHLDRSSDRYRYPDAERECGPDEVDGVLRSIHKTLFDEWLGLTLEDQMHELKLFCSVNTTVTELPVVVERWSRSQLFQRLPPPQAVDADRKLFSASADILLCLAASQLRTDVESVQTIRRITRILTFLEGHAAPWQLTLQAISREVHLSGDYVRHLFKSATGVTLRRFLRYVRMNRAAYLLRSTFLSVEEVALRVDYEHTTNFTRDFRSVAGLSPASYRIARSAFDVRFGEPGTSAADIDRQ